MEIEHCILKSYTTLLFLFSGGMLLPDRVDSNVGVLGVDSSHNGPRRLVFLNLKRVTGSYEHRRLVCILHWNLQTQERLHFTSSNTTVIFIMLDTLKQTQSVGHAAWCARFQFQNTTCLWFFFFLAYFNACTFIVASSLYGPQARNWGSM